MIPKPYKTRGCPVPYPQYHRIFNGLTGQKNPENDTEKIQNYRLIRHTRGNGRKERIFMPRMSKKRRLEWSFFLRN